MQGPQSGSELSVDSSPVRQCGFHTKNVPPHLIFFSFAAPSRPVPVSHSGLHPYPAQSSQTGL